MSDTNYSVITGRITKDVHIEKTTTGIDVIRFTVASNRMKKPEEEQAQADFIQCIAWRNTATYLARYASKGDLLLVEGRIQTSNYKSKDGHTVYGTKLVANRVQILQRVNYQPKQETVVNELKTDDMSEFEDVSGVNIIADDDLPF